MSTVQLCNTQLEVFIMMSR